MNKFVAFLGMVIMIAISVVLLFMSTTQPNLFFVSGLCFALGIYFCFGLFDGAKKARVWVTGFLLIGFVAGASWGRTKAMNRELAGFLACGSSCTHPCSAFFKPESSMGFVLRLGENVCYQQRLRRHVGRQPLPEQSTMVIEAAKRFKGQERLDPTTFALLASELVRVKLKQKKDATEPAEVRGVMLSLIEELVQLMEIEPVLQPPTSGAGEARQMAQIQYDLGRKGTLKMLATIHKATEKYEQAKAEEGTVVTEAPAASTDPSARFVDPLTQIHQRLAVIQANWNIAGPETALEDPIVAGESF